MAQEVQSQFLMLEADCPKFPEGRRQEPLAEVLLLILVLWACIRRQVISPIIRFQITLSIPVLYDKNPWPAPRHKCQLSTQRIAWEQGEGSSYPVCFHAFITHFVPGSLILTENQPSLAKPEVRERTTTTRNSNKKESKVDRFYHHIFIHNLNIIIMKYH